MTRIEILTTNGFEASALVYYPRNFANEWSIYAIPVGQLATAETIMEAANNNLSQSAYIRDIKDLSHGQWTRLGYGEMSESVTEFTERLNTDWAELVDRYTTWTAE